MAFRRIVKALQYRPCRYLLAFLCLLILSISFRKGTQQLQTPKDGNSMESFANIQALNAIKSARSENLEKFNDEDKQEDLENMQVWNTVQERDEEARLPNEMRRLPQCIIIGTMKSGTKALLEYMGLHPRVKTAAKEQFFFSVDENYGKGFEYYRNQMPLSKPGDITIEKTPSYLESKTAMERIHEFNSSIKLLVVFKHPVTRAISDYRHFKARHSYVVENFEDYVADKATGELNLTSRPLRLSLYAEQLQRWYSVFPRNQIHAVDGEVLITDPLKEIFRVEAFLGIGHAINRNHVTYDEKKGFFCMRKKLDEKFQCLSKDKGVTPPYVDPNFIEKLNNFYHPHNERLFKLINRTFDWK